MLSTKPRMNHFEVYVLKSYDFDSMKKACKWLGHSRWKCGNCKTGYFDVRSENDHDDLCPGCDYIIVLRWKD